MATSRVLALWMEPSQLQVKQHAYLYSFLGDCDFQNHLPMTMKPTCLFPYTHIPRQGRGSPLCAWSRDQGLGQAESEFLLLW